MANEKCNFISLHGRLNSHVPLNRYTTFKIGGPARILVEPKDIPCLKVLLYVAREQKLPVYIIGSGSNILVCDEELNAMVIKLNSVCFRKIIKYGGRLEAGSGVILARLVLEAKKAGLAGIEFLAGIPGTVGGALAMNAGACGKGIGDMVDKVTVMDYKNKIKVIPKNKIKFVYRNSSLAKYIILSASFKLSKGKRSQIQENICKNIQNRRNSQDYSFPNAGCIFKNPKRDLSAGRLIDLCGLKGKRIGGAEVSSKHANFILNTGNASAKNVLRLMDYVRMKVKNKFNVNLEPEIKIWK